MKSLNPVSRRTVVKSSIFGLLAAAIPSIVYSNKIFELNPRENDFDELFHRYPSIDDRIVNDVVGKSHFDLDAVKQLVDKRPELARATWDWGFGDFESAIGAASHVGRRDIVRYLLSKGARPNIFTFAALGAFETVKSMIDTIPGIQTTAGPHGISLLQHAESGLRTKDTMEKVQLLETEKLIAYLIDLGNAGGEMYKDIEEKDKEKFLGDYKYGDGPKDGFTIKINMRKMLSLGKLGQFGGGLNHIGNNRFLYNGVTSVIISFQLENGIVNSLTVEEPDLVLVAHKI